MTSLSQDISDFKAAMAGKIPANVRDVMQQAMGKIASSGVGRNAPKAGDLALDFTLPNASGHKVTLSDLYQQWPVILIFYRGGWCPFCNLELKAYQRELPNFTKAGIQLVAVSPEKPDQTMTTKEKNALGFEVLSDTENSVSRSYGLLFDLPAELIPIYQDFGVDLLRHNSVGAWQLPVPGTFVIAKGGKVIRASAEIDYTNRMEPTDCLASLLASA